MQIKVTRKFGFTLVEIMIVVAIIGLLAAIAIPNLSKARTSAQKTACVNNLRQIDGAMEQFALEAKRKQGDAITASDVSPYLKGNVMPRCPSDDSAYTVSAVGTAPTCPNSNLGHTL